MAKSSAQPRGEGESLFLRDEPVERVEDDSFAHTAQVEALREIVTRCPTPFCVGVFGKWGTGKSGIAKRLKERLKQSGQPVVLSDAWQFVGDSFRRKFLIDCDEQLEAGLGYRGKLAQVVSEVVESEIRFDWKRIMLHLLMLSALFGVAALLLRGYVGVLPLVGSSYTLAALFVLIHGFAREISATVKVLPKSVTYPRIDSAEQFHQSFVDLLNAKAVTSAKRIVFIIDNLDRCQSDTVLEVFSALKAFLDCRRCVYVVPCDDAAVRAHISAALKTENPPEFMRKLFHAAVRLQSPIEEELYRYVRRLCDGTSLPIGEAGRSVLFAASSLFGNPRLMKSIINNAAADYLLAEQLEVPSGEAILRQGAITGQVPFLLKLVVIRDQWPWFYRAIMRNYRLLDTAVTSAGTLASSPNADTEFRKTVEGAMGEIREAENQGVSLLRRFLAATQSVTATNIEDFLRFKATTEEARIPDREAFRDTLLTRQVAEVKRCLEEAAASEPDQVPYYFRYALYVIRDLLDQNDHTLALNAVAALVEAAVDVPGIITDGRAVEIVHLVVGSPIRHRLDELNAEALLRLCRNAPASRDRGIIVTALLPTIPESGPFPRGRFLLLMAYRDLWNSSHRQRMQQLPIEKYEKEELSILETLEAAMAADGYEDVFSDALFEKVVGLIATGPFDEASARRLRLAVASFGLVKGDPAKSALAGKIAGILTYPTVSEPAWAPQRQSALEAFAALEPDQLPPGFADTVAEPLLQFLGAIAAAGDLVRVLAILDVLIVHRGALSDGNREQLRTRVANAVPQLGQPLVSALLFRLHKLDPAEPLWDTVVQTSGAFVKSHPERGLLVEFGKALPDAERQREVALLADLVSVGPQATSELALAVSVERSEALTASADIAPLLAVVAEKATSVPVVEKPSYYDFLFTSSLKDQQLIVQMTDELVGWLTGADPAQARFAADQLAKHRGLLAASLRRQVAARLAGWLRDQTVDGMRIEAWNTALLYRDDLHEGSAAELADAALKLLTSPDSGHRVRGVQYSRKLAGKVQGHAAARLVTGLSTVLDKPDINPKDAYDSMCALLPPGEWESAAHEHVKDKLEYLSAHPSESGVQEWARSVLSERGQSEVRSIPCDAESSNGSSASE